MTFVVATIEIAGQRGLGSQSPPPGTLNAIARLLLRDDPRQNCLHCGSLLHGGLEWRVGALRRYPSCDADEFGLPELAHSVERFDRDGNLGHTSGVVA